VAKYQAWRLVVVSSVDGVLRTVSSLRTKHRLGTDGGVLEEDLE
jgi:hypothetical protein